MSNGSAGNISVEKVHLRYCVLYDFQHWNNVVVAAENFCRVFGECSLSNIRANGGYNNLFTYIWQLEISKFLEKIMALENGKKI